MRFGFAVVVIFSNGGFSRAVGTTAFTDLIMRFTINIVCTRNDAVFRSTIYRLRAGEVLYK